tara:strand:+ start:330 stop:725 length:396 start_codon:yes stop_codon:yes gene_type:complete
MATRDKPNSYFAWYNDDDKLAIVVNQASSNDSKGVSAGEYDTYLDANVTDGIKMTVHSKYEEVTALANDLADESGVDSTMHAFILDYVKSRILEDMGQVEMSQYFRTKYENGIRKAPTRRSGVRMLTVPKL